MKHTLAFEVGTEEIPAFDLHKAFEQLGQIVPRALQASRIPHGDIVIYTTPRRLIVQVSDVADLTETVQEVWRGPSVKIAFDAQGKPTKAAHGFARSKGVELSDLERAEEQGVEYVFATRSFPAQAVADLLPAVLEGVMASITWSKSCRWGTNRVYFSRPVRWLLALLDDRVLPVHFAGLTAQNLTYGHRFLAPGPYEVPTASGLIDLLRGAFLVLSEDERRDIIMQGVKRVEEKERLKASLPAKTLLEVINLTEYPTVLEASFDESFLAIPPEIIVDVMLMHQRYFPLYDEHKKLTNKFLVVTNGNPACAQGIISGNERVVRARLADAQFFFEEDLKHPLESYVERLDEVVFQEQLGTMKAKTERVVALTKQLGAAAHLQTDEFDDALRAAYLSKADLVTNAVVEFTSVQGVMGSYYAVASGETERVSQAIADHYRPRFSGDDLPRSRAGMMVAITDKLDTICGLFAVGQAPSGSSDPFALRRSAIGIIAMLEQGLAISLTDAVDASLHHYEQAGIEFNRDQVSSQVADFFIARTKTMLRDRAASPDVIDAILGAKVREPAEIIARVQALLKARVSAPEDFDDLATAYTRANNLRDADLGQSVDESLMGGAEKALITALQSAETQVSKALDNNDYEKALVLLAALRLPIDRFFEEVLIMDEKPSLRHNRLRLLNRFVAVFSRVADFGKLA